MSQFQLSQSQMDKLLAMAGKKMGTDPETLKQKMQNGQTDSLLGSLSKDKQQKISALMQNPEAMDKFMQNPKVQQLLRTLMGK